MVYDMRLKLFEFRAYCPDSPISNDIADVTFFFMAPTFGTARQFFFESLYAFISMAAYKASGGTMGVDEDLWLRTLIINPSPTKETTWEADQWHGLIIERD